MRVSIIIPAFNMSPWIAETIESALAQTYSPKDILVIDDGSTDSTLSIAMRYDVFIVSTSNRGLASARNCGLMNTSGELVLAIDADDRISPDFLAKTVPLMTPGVGIVSSDMQTFGLKSQLIRTEPATLRSEMTGANTIPVCSLIRRKCLLECGGWNTNLDAWEDYSLWIDILKHGWSHAVIHEPLFHYRIRDGQMSEKTTHRQEHYWDLVKKCHPDLFG